MSSTPKPAISEPHEHDHEFDTPRKRAICGLLCYTNLTKAEIWHQTEIPPHTGYCILNTDISWCEGKYCAEWPSKIDRNIIEKMVKHITEWYSKHTITWEALSKECGVIVNFCTIQRTMNRTEYTKCRACQKTYLSSETVKKWEVFVLKHESWQLNHWKKIDLEQFT